MNDGGKGSARRPGEGYQDNWERIWGKKNLPVTMEPDEDDDNEKLCPRCGTEMSVTEAGQHWHCDVCGNNEKIERGEP